MKNRELEMPESLRNMEVNGDIGLLKKAKNVLEEEVRLEWRQLGYNVEEFCLEFYLALKIVKREILKEEEKSFVSYLVQKIKSAESEEDFLKLIEDLEKESSKEKDKVGFREAARFEIEFLKKKIEVLILVKPRGAENFRENVYFSIFCNEI